MIAGNYPETILTKLKSGNLWESSIVYFSIFNLIYLSHNIVENQGLNLLEETISDQSFLLLYYFLAIILVTILFKVFKIQCSISILTQYFLSTSIIFSVIYIIDVPILILGYNFDIFLSLLEFVLLLWISGILVKHFVVGRTKYIVLLGIMCIFYLTTLLRAIFLLAIGLFVG